MIDRPPRGVDFGAHVLPCSFGSRCRVPVLVWWGFRHLLCAGESQALLLLGTTTSSAALHRSSFR
jgi:hypothetical protein